MKSMKYVVLLATGLIALGTFSAQAIMPVSPAAGPLTITVKTYQQSYTTDNLGVITFISTPVTLNNATLLAKVVSATGITVPAGARLAFSFTYDYLNGVFPGDVVIVNAAGKIIFDLNDFGTDTGFARIQVFFNDDVDETHSASKSSTTTAKGRGELYFDIYSYDTEETAGTGIFGDFFDNFGTGQYVRAYSGSELTTGSASFAGGGEFVSFVGLND